ncbi:hypothetical protein D5b_00025 [Faustovirus]|nr:hypothetical protein D5b_00025 [Faustovirus]AMN84884.1 hypothetical protein D6_00485 [Faustovirus]AMP43984.1 hypothetical protein PRJ_Dakar_00024 [Faustovirus]
MFALAAFCSPVIVGAWWRLQKTQLYGVVAGAYISHITDGTLWRKLRHKHELQNRSLPLTHENNTSPVLPDDIIYLIGCQHYKVYAQMLMVNKTLNTMLKQFDAWGAFCKVTESKRYTECVYPGINITTVELTLVGTGGDKIRHGETVEYHERNKYGRVMKWEIHRHYRFGELLRYENYTIGRNHTSSEAKRKSYEVIYWPKTAHCKHRYRAEYWYDQYGHKCDSMHYRDGDYYSPVAEIIEMAALVICGGLVVAGIGVIVVNSVKRK